MNDALTHSKLKIRNRILAIAIAFLLLTLTIALASCVGGSKDQSNNSSGGEVNTQGAVTLTGKVVNDTSAPIAGASVAAFKDSERVCASAKTSETGEFSLTLNEKVKANDSLMVMTTSKDYAFEVTEVKADTETKSIKLVDKSAVNIKPLAEFEAVHSSFVIKTKVGDQESTENYTKSKTFAYQFPVGGSFQMTHNAHLKFHYQNSLKQDVDVEVVGNANEWYRPYYWGYQDNKLNASLMTINQDYILDKDHTYTIALAYIGQAQIQFNSTSENHGNFHFVFEKNGSKLQDLNQKSFNTTTHAGTQISVQDNGSLMLYFSDSDEANNYVVEATVEPVAKSGYKISSWIYNGKELKTGDKVKAEVEGNMSFEPNYVVDDNAAPVDMMVVIGIIAVVVIATVIIGFVIYRRTKK